MSSRTYYLSDEALSAHRSLKERGRNCSQIVQDALIAAASGKSASEAAALAMVDRHIDRLQDEIFALDKERTHLVDTLEQRGQTTLQHHEAQEAERINRAKNTVAEWMNATGGREFPAAGWSQSRIEVLCEALGYDNPTEMVVDYVNKVGAFA